MRGCSKKAYVPLIRILCQQPVPATLMPCGHRLFTPWWSRGAWLCRCWLCKFSPLASSPRGAAAAGDHLRHSYQHPKWCQLGFYCWHCGEPVEEQYRTGHRHEEVRALDQELGRVTNVPQQPHFQLESGGFWMISWPDCCDPILLGVQKMLQQHNTNSYLMNCDEALRNQLRSSAWDLTAWKPVGFGMGKPRASARRRLDLRRPAFAKRPKHL